MRPQYHFRDSPQGLHAWSVRRLVELSGGLISQQLPLSAIRELDEPFWNGGKKHPLTCHEIAGHARLISESDLSFPIILSSDGRVMDGMHRVCKALNLGLETIAAVRFAVDPEPDYIGVHPDDLPYDE
jgi:hypothetical protein